MAPILRTMRVVPPHAGEDADHDFWQADIWPWGCRHRKCGASPERQFQTNAQRRAGQGRRNRLAALFGLGVHARALDLPQQRWCICP